ncbi:MAG: metallophosphoesterase [Bacteroidales bacterium]|nr:metallophosphoesterase [Bacteroidales bacterium]
MNRNLCILAAALMMAVSCGQKPQHHLTLIHLNDTHSHFEPVRAGEQAGLGGIVERAAYIDSVRQADGPENVLLLHAGDFSQGSTYFTELDGNLEIEGLNALGYDVVTLGNHEFDNWLDDLGRRLSSLEMPVVVCNYDFSPFEAGKYITPYAIVEKAGLKIGVLGVLCNLKDMVSGDVAERVPEFDLVPTVQHWADYLRDDEKCDLVIALTHIGYESHNPGDVTDPVLCSKTRNIDLFVGGHSHTFLKEMKYHKNLAGKDIPVVQDGCWGLYVGQVDIWM